MHTELCVTAINLGTAILLSDLTPPQPSMEYIYNINKLNYSTGVMYTAVHAYCLLYQNFTFPYYV